MANGYIRIGLDNTKEVTELVEGSPVTSYVVGTPFLPSDAYNEGVFENIPKTILLDRGTYKAIDETPIKIPMPIFTDGIDSNGALVFEDNALAGYDVYLTPDDDGRWMLSFVAR